MIEIAPPDQPTTRTNGPHKRNFSHAMLRRMRAGALLDCISHEFISSP